MAAASNAVKQLCLHLVGPPRALKLVSGCCRAMQLLELIFSETRVVAGLCSLDLFSLSCQRCWAGHFYAGGEVV